MSFLAIITFQLKKYYGLNIGHFYFGYLGHYHVGGTGKRQKAPRNPGIPDLDKFREMRDEWPMTPDHFKMLQGLAFLGGLVLFLAAELVRPYRQPTVAKMPRFLINLALALLNSVILSLLFSAPTAAAAAYVTANRLGVLHLLALPRWSQILLTILLMDFMLYLWHLLNHVLPLLWRFHSVHHSDLNMDVSTASRFHLGELLPAGLIKIGLIYFLGAELVGIVLFESLLVLTSQFEHSSLKVPAWFERAFWLCFVPPAMHRIHHSVKIRERNTNYGTILSLWDRMFGTLLREVDQETIVIGVGAYREPEKLKVRHLLWMPFTREVA